MQGQGHIPARPDSGKNMAADKSMSTTGTKLRGFGFPLWDTCIRQPIDAPPEQS
jgi:hypothetical protein